MADAVTSQTLQDGPRSAILKFTNLSDGTGESAVTKVNVSTLTTNRGVACSGCSIELIQYNVTGMQVTILWDATTDVPALVLEGRGTFDFTQTSQITNNSGTGKNGNILFTTTNHTAGDSYSIIMKVVKYY